MALTTLTNLANGQLFGVDIHDNLYQINPTTGAATEVGSTGLGDLAGVGFQNSLASDGTHLYYTLGFNDGIDKLYALNTTTGAASLVGSTGTTDIVGSAFAGPTPGTGQLYGFRTNGDTDVINTSTGAATFLNSNGITDIFGGVGNITSLMVPELPTSVMTLISGAMGLLYYGHRLRRGSRA